MTNMQTLLIHFLQTDTCKLIQDVIFFYLTSHMKMSKILVATGRGKEVRKMVRNQEDAYMEV